MRLRTDIFVDGLRRYVQSRGEYSTVLRKGHAEAGAVAMVLRNANGVCTILTEARAIGGEATWTEVKRDLDDIAVSEWVRRESNFDTDLWVLEVEGLTPEDFATLTR